MVIADTLSRAYIPYTPSDDLEEELNCAVHMVLEKSSATYKGLQNVRKNTETDHSLQRLQSFIRTGWPDNRVDLPEDIHAYWNCREELSEVDGIILKGEQIVIPVNMRRTSSVEYTVVTWALSNAYSEQKMLYIGQASPKTLVT